MLSEGEAMAEEYDGGDPVGTVTDLRTQEPRTLRLDAAGCELLRKILVGEAPDLAAEPGPVLEAADIAYDRTHPNPYASWVNGEPPASTATPGPATP